MEDATLKEALAGGVQTSAVQTDGNAWANTPLTQIFAWSPVPHVLDVRDLIVTAFQRDDGSTVIRVDAVVTWVTPRPASERIPAGVNRITVALAPGAADGSQAGKAIVVTSPATDTPSRRSRRAASNFHRRSSPPGDA
ncbi:MAG: hypothetical protein ABSG64_06335 [Solirubrobacteraceae bacterium]